MLCKSYFEFASFDLASFLLHCVLRPRVRPVSCFFALWLCASASGLTYDSACNLLSKVGRPGSDPG